MRSLALKIILVSFLCFYFVIFPQQVKAETAPLRIAVAANFYPVLEQLLPEFQKVAKLTAAPNIQLISAASGTLYQQISHGAPFDVFLSADAIRPQQLVDRQLADASSLKTYAIGQLSLWSANQAVDSLAVLSAKPSEQNKLAIANPNIAPYGIAAKEVLTKLNLWQSYKHKLITGININQTFQQVHSGAINLGIVAKSQLVLNNLQGFDIPEHLYTPIAQQLVIINNTKHAELAQQFCAFLLSAPIQQKLALYGYHSPLFYNQKVAELITAEQ